MKNSFKKKLKIFAFVGVLGVVLAGGLVLYVGWQGVKFVSTAATQVSANANPEELITEAETKLKTEVEKLSSFNIAGCLATVQKNLSLEAVWNEPIVEKLKTVKQECLGPALQEPEKVQEGESV